MPLTAAEKATTIKRPSWVEALLEHFEYVDEETRLVKEGQKERKRTFYRLRCILCSKAGAPVTPVPTPVLTSASPPPEKEKRTAKVSTSTKDYIHDGNASFNFTRHLQRSHPDVSIGDGVVNGLKRKRNTDENEDTEATIVKSIVRKIAPKSDCDSGALFQRGATSSSTASAQVSKYDRNGHKQKWFELLVLDYVATDNLPFISVERQGFRNFVAGLDAKFTCPSRRSLSRLLFSKETQILQHIKATLQDLKVGTAHLILDIWSSRQNMSVIGVQVRFIKNWEINQCIIGFKHFPEAHIAENIKSKVQGLLGEFGLSMLDFLSVTADNASAILSAFRFSNLNETAGSSQVSVSSATTSGTATTSSITNLNIINSNTINDTICDEDDDEPHPLDIGVGADVVDDISYEEINGEFINRLEIDIDAAIDSVITEWVSAEMLNVRRNSCLAHLLQLGIKDALSCKPVESIITKVNKIVTWFHKSPKQSANLRELSGGIGVVKPCDTRWNSTYYCLERMCKVVKVLGEDGRREREETIANVVNTVLHKIKTSKDAKSKKRQVPTSLTDEEIASIQIIVKILEPLAILTDLWQGNGVTSSMVILGLVDCVRALDEVTNEEIMDQLLDADLCSFKTSLRDRLIERFATRRSSLEPSVTANDGDEHMTMKNRRIVRLDAFNERSYLLATVLDPRLKLIPFEDGFSSGLSQEIKYPTKEEVLYVLKLAFKEEEKRLLAKDNEIQVLSDSDSQTRTASPTTTTPAPAFNEEGEEEGIPEHSSSSKGSMISSSPTATAKSVKKAKYDVFSRVSEHQAALASKDKGIDEIESYISSSTINNRENPLTFWRLNAERFPILSCLAIKFLAMPASSASVERVFSVAGAIISSHRASMKIETAEQLILYKEYIRQGF